MNVLIIGSGGREHAIAWKLSQSPELNKLFIAPGNAGTASAGKNLPINVADFSKVKKAVLDHQISLVIVGPEESLVKGLADMFAADEDLMNVRFIGPGKAGAMLEGSKQFAKDFMQRHDIPTAAYQSFDPGELDAAMAFARTMRPPYVVKADGLAAGKGVLICGELQEVEQALQDILVDKKFGDAGNKVVIEAFLDGIELSVFVLTDGKNYRILPEAKDYKRIGEGDTGLNTGGMGAISPVPFADQAFMQKVEEQIVRPTLSGLKADGIPYCGFIFIGLMNVNGDPYVIEYNVRMGDPETEVVMPRIANDLLPVMIACAEGRLNEVTLQIKPETAATVVVVSGGYPGTYPKGLEISGTNDSGDALIFHAGTKHDAAGSQTLTNGGRVLAVTGLGKDIPDALQISYDAIHKIRFDGMYYRKDIGMDLQKTLQD
ncbi:MAG: phosphoribosylamine--glycine ligase [Flavobacteriales bacterium]|nr:phosphoribosylamine--glycine ligase [Flavobacteriales bacterium]